MNTGNIAFIGLGRMGRELVQHLIADGRSVTVWNRTKAAARPALESGAMWADSPDAAVTSADILVTVLFGPDTVRQTILEAGLPLPAGLTWVDITTIGPADAAEFEQACRARGVTYVHSPVIGSLAPARQRKLGVLVGGAKDGVDTVLPLVRTWADPGRVHTFDTAAKAAAGKLVANAALAISMQGVTETLRVGHGGGLSTEEVLALLLDGTPLQAMAGLKGDAIRSRAFDDTQFSANALAKDAGLMMRTADRPLPALSAAYAALEAAKAAGLGENDFSVIAGDDS